LHSWVKARNQAISLAKTDTDRALEIARQIHEPWNRAQALAWIGFFADGRLHEILDEARAVSWSATDPYQIVGSSAWRLRAWIERGEPTRATKELGQLLACADKITHPVSRLEALTALRDAIFDVDGARQRVLDAQIRAAGIARSWRSSSRLRDSAIMLASTGHADEARRVVAAIPEGRYRRQALKGIAEAKLLDPRRFFW
jgi:hypothetical protein